MTSPRSPRISRTPPRPRRPRGQQTHADLLQVAARALRAKGPERVSVPDIMGEAGLTHGGFYAHFASKDALIAEAIGTMFADSRSRFDARHGDKQGAAWLAARADAYVTAKHRDDPGGGCPITTLSGDIRHLSPEARAAFDAGIKGLIERLTRHGNGSREAALTLLAEMAGAVILARAVADRELSDAILNASLASLHRRIDALEKIAQ